MVCSLSLFRRIKQINFKCTFFTRSVSGVYLNFICFDNLKWNNKKEHKNIIICYLNLDDNEENTNLFVFVLIKPGNLSELNTQWIISKDRVRTIHYICKLNSFVFSIHYNRFICCICVHVDFVTISYNRSLRAYTLYEHTYEHEKW